MQDERRILFAYSSPLRPSSPAVRRVMFSTASAIEEEMMTQAVAASLLQYQTESTGDMSAEEVAEAEAYLSRISVAHRVTRSTATAECPICMEAIAGAERAVTIACGHLYHHACLRTWVATSRTDTCPKCRRPVTHRKG